MIAYLGLSQWWDRDLPAETRDRIREKFQPMGADSSSIDQGAMLFSSASAIQFLSGMAGWFTSANDLPIARVVIAKAESLIDGDTDPLEIHFLYSTKIDIYRYRRAERGTEEIFRDACRKQIGIAPSAAARLREEYGNELPGHRGYDCLAAALERDRSFEEVITLCQQARDMGWSGDWDNRIEKCAGKLLKASKRSP